MLHFTYSPIGILDIGLATTFLSSIRKYSDTTHSFELELFDMTNEQFVSTLIASLSLFPEFYTKQALTVWRSPLHAVFHWNVKGKTRKNRKNTAGFVASSRDRPYNLSCLSAVSKNGRFCIFLGFGVSFGGEKPFVTSNASFLQETRVWSAKTNETVRWLLPSACVRIRYCPEAPSSSTVDVKCRFSRFQFSALWSNGLASSVFIFAPILLRCYVFFKIYSSMQGLKYSVADFLISTCKKKLFFVKADRVG